MTISKSLSMVVFVVAIVSAIMVVPTMIVIFTVGPMMVVSLFVLVVAH